MRRPALRPFHFHLERRPWLRDGGHEMEMPDLGELLDPTDTVAFEKRRDDLPDIEDDLAEDDPSD